MNYRFHGRYDMIRERHYDIVHTEHIKSISIRSKYYCKTGCM